MPIQLYNTLTRSVDELQPLDDHSVKMYTCGLTVYSQPHIGNWVGYIYWDVLVRVLLDQGFAVKRVQNITDVGHLTSDDDSGEDKMEQGAQREGLTAWDVAEKYIRIADHEAYDLLKLKRPDELVRATDCVDRQIDFVRQLEQTGYTYTIAGEGIYFDTSKLADYGKLARLDIEGLRAGARVSVEGKRNITDFALWKFSPRDKQRDMEWDSPWGRGFPGWHLECSTIARQFLGDQIDIHTGGIDHISVHHTNEIAQTEALTGTQFSSMWLHNNHLKVDGKKMSKSLGNIYTLANIIDKGFDVMAYKILVLAKHYRTEGNFTWKNLRAAQNRLNTYRSMADIKWQTTADGAVTTDEISKTKQRMQAALCTDLNTPMALSELSQLETRANSSGINNAAREAFSDFLSWLDTIFGLDLAARSDITESQKKLLEERQTARSTGDWNTADRLRTQLGNDGIMIRDTDSGQVWSRLG